MNLKAVSFVVVLLFAVGGTAVAGALDEPSNMAPFYADSALKQLKPMPEFKAAFMSMPQERRDLVVRLCSDPAQSTPHTEFCANVKLLAGN